MKGGELYELSQRLHNGNSNCQFIFRGTQINMLFFPLN